MLKGEHPPTPTKLPKNSPVNNTAPGRANRPCGEVQRSIFIVGGVEHNTDHGFVGNHDGGNHIDDYNCALMKRPNRKKAVHQTCPRRLHTSNFPSSFSWELHGSRYSIICDVAAGVDGSVSEVFLSVSDDDYFCQRIRIIQIVSTKIRAAT